MGELTLQGLVERYEEATDEVGYVVGIAAVLLAVADSEHCKACGQISAAELRRIAASDGRGADNMPEKGEEP